MFFSKNIKKTITLFTDISIKFVLIFILIDIRAIAHVDNMSFENTNINERYSIKSTKDSFLNVFMEFPYLEPKIEIIMENGEKIPLKNFRKKLLILYFYATWCTTCHKEIKSLDKLAAELKFRDIDDILIIPVCEDYISVNKVREFYEVMKIKNLSIFVDESKKAFSLFKITSLPTTFLVNKEGYIILKTDQTHNWEDKSLITKLIDIRNQTIPKINNPVKNDYEKQPIEDIIQNNPATNKTIMIN